MDRLVYNPKLGAFATGNPAHARRFRRKGEAGAWMARLKREIARPVRLKG